MKEEQHIDDDADKMALPPSPVTKDSKLGPFAVISICYLLFTVTDGAIRMIVLLFAYSLSFSALEVAVMFSLYELAGVVTNLLAGVAGAKWGIKITLIYGLVLQLMSYSMLFAWNDTWTKGEAIPYVTFACMLGGIAKDLTKLGGKTVTKLVTKEGQDTKLFKIVSLLTGWKNSLKGVGYFLGSFLLSISYPVALSSMMALILIALPFAFTLDPNLGTSKSKNVSLKDVFVMDNVNLNYLSLARLFLFASRDFWFEVPLPFYLRSPDCNSLGDDFPCDPNSQDSSSSSLLNNFCTDGSECSPELSICVNSNPGGGCGGLGASKLVVGTSLALYIILYGQVQSWTPQLVTGPLSQNPPNKLTEVLWGLINIVPTLVAAGIIHFSNEFNDHDEDGMAIWLMCIIGSFAVIFAINSSIHSYLVVKYAKLDKVAVSVGFYYMSNAAGRLLGTLGSGLIYTYAGEDEGAFKGTNGTRGLAACFVAGTITSLLAALITLRIEDEERGLNCGSFECVKEVEVDDFYERDENDKIGREDGGDSGARGGMLRIEENNSL